MKVLITGGAGFVGSSLCRKFKESNPKAEVVAFDNLKRRGSEINLADFKRRGIGFVHGDIRNLEDIKECGTKFDLMVEASAEPSVHAGQNGSTNYLVHTNLLGTYNALEYARASVGALIFLSTSRVYSIEPLKSLKLNQAATRFDFESSQSVMGASALGINEKFSVAEARSLYGATKLASELLLQEYAFSFGLNAIVNRCGVIAGPGQFGKVDQGVFTLWVARHQFNKGLTYTGFGGKGQQVRDLLHPDDLYSLVEKQFNAIKNHSGQIYNVGGGAGSGSVSLQELTKLCQEATSQSIAIGSDSTTSPVDIPWYVTDSSLAKRDFSWAPQKSARDIVFDIAGWFQENREQLKELF